MGLFSSAVEPSSFGAGLRRLFFPVGIIAALCSAMLFADSVEASRAPRDKEESPRQQAKLIDPPRTGHTATLLKTGTLLVTGGHRTFGRVDPARFKNLFVKGQVPGQDPGAFPDGWVSFNRELADAALFDPRKGTWAAGPAMSSSRTGHTATLLRDGRVLVTGGFVRGAAPPLLASAEIFDPKTASWQAAGTMDEAVLPVPGADTPGRGARAFHTATLLQDGKVLVASGATGIDRHSSAYASDGLLFDPETNKWSPTDSLGTSRGGHTATLLKSGKVLVAGGADFDGSPLAEIYDPKEQTWSPKRATKVRGQHTATELSDGRVLLAGGANRGVNDSPIQSVEIYNPKTNTFTAASPLRQARRLHAAVRLPGGKVLVAGGFGGAGGLHPVPSAEIYDPAVNRWKSLGTISPGTDAGAPAEIMAPGQSSATVLPGRSCGNDCRNVFVIGGTFDAPLSHLLQVRMAPMRGSEAKSSPLNLPARIFWPALAGVVVAALLVALARRRGRKDLAVDGRPA